MEKRTARNMRIKRKYLVWMRDAKGLARTSIDKAAASIDRYSDYTKGADFSTFHAEKARGFKRRLESARSSATGEPLSAGTIDGILRDVRAFFAWLADQPGYRSKISRADVAYLSSARKLVRSAHDSLWKPHPTPAQARHAISMMPAQTVFERRDRAALAFLFLTGSRDGAAITLRLRHVDLASACVHFDGREVATKFGKRFTTTFFPVGDGVRRIFEDWIDELRRDPLRGTDDWLFPRTKVILGGTGRPPVLELDHAPWSSAAQIRKTFKRAFEAVGLPPHPPHRIRDTLAAMASEFCLTPEDYKAWSQNLGHDDVLTTLRSYGSVAPARQLEILTKMAADASSELARSYP